MREYSPRRRTALVLTGTGTSGAYHAGVLRALDESGVKIDLVVGSGVGTVGGRVRRRGGRAPALRRGRVLGRRRIRLAVSAARRAADRDPPAGVLVRRLPAARRHRTPGRGPLPSPRPGRPRDAGPHRAHDRGDLDRPRRAPRSRTWSRSPCRSSCCARWPSSPSCAWRSATGGASPNRWRPSSIPRWARCGWARGSGRSRAAPPSPPSRPRRRRSAASTWGWSPRTSASPASAS